MFILKANFIESFAIFTLLAKSVVLYQRHFPRFLPIQFNSIQFSLYICTFRVLRIVYLSCFAVVKIKMNTICGRMRATFTRTTSEKCPSGK